MTHYDVRDKNNKLLSTLSGNTIQLTSVAKAILETVVTPYLAKTWFRLMPNPIYQQRIKMLDLLIDGVSTSITARDDSDLLKALQLSKLEEDQSSSNKLKPLMDNVLLAIANGTLSISVATRSGDIITLSDGIRAMASALTNDAPATGEQPDINELTAENTQLRSSNAELLERITSLETTVKDQRDDIAKLSSDMKTLMEALKNIHSQDPQAQASRVDGVNEQTDNRSAQVGMFR